MVLVPGSKDKKEHFSNEPEDREISVNSFRNEDLPNLRARYLKEMIGAFTKKFDPIVLEGVVKEYESENERNAVIYLFFPEDLVDEYKQD